MKALHKMSIEQASKEMAAAGLALDRVRDELPMRHLMILRVAGPGGD